MTMMRAVVCFPPSRIADVLGAIGNPAVAGKLVITMADGWP
jgi:hypothetical protein